jgi:NADH:ubiquinone oxidoreductase subunit F (NADH-binding)
VYARPWHTEVESWAAEWGETGEPAAALSRIPRRSLVDPPAVLRHVMGADRDAPFEDYDLPDAATILQRVEAARLDARGATIPAARKWVLARDTPAPERYVVANGDEGDPGSYIDRLLLEEDPHAVLAGMLACARVIGARRGFVFVRGEYPRAEAAMRAAVARARTAGRLGPAFDVEVLAGAGSYVCGEETALLRSIEGLRGEPRPRPPHPAESGLWGMPTVVQNVETLALVPCIARTGSGGGSKAFSVSGAVARPGVIEARLGVRLSVLLDEAGGAPPGRRWKMALVGGPTGRVVPAAEFDVSLSPEHLPGLGHGGVVVLDDRVSARQLAFHLADFARAESCGTCTPCRTGTSQLRFVRTRDALERLLETLEIGSLCGFGQGVPRPFRDLLRHFAAEMFP